MKNWYFFREAMKSFRTTGSITSSSKALVNKLVEPLPAHRPLVIVELGPGDGCVTRAILDKVHPESKVTAFEINPVFVEKLASIKDERLRVLPTGAERLTDYVEPATVDYVVSSLPLSMIPKGVKETILKQSQLVLRPDGRYLQFQYALQDYGLLKDYFNRVSVSFTMANLPPAFIYSCSLSIV
ncbi:methyltransferase domain-containing protein [Neolewinella aurantiaca]|uniref:Methyltransferase domain-containing protein n=1 Tax=Neolewinella aurantiaca TaxID=2602767 RepID=A0A5C7G008_9BACT|nr:methyltransferase domain-containing protein [Neolewinella aurantiaca]TXF90936.1 methyltransferase domain-containing protein [Neolewinella aurantiaca]